MCAIYHLRLLPVHGPPALEIQILSHVYSSNCLAHRTFVFPELHWKIQWLVSTLTKAMQLLHLLRNQLCSEEMPAWPGCACDPALQHQHL